MSAGTKTPKVKKRVGSYTVTKPTSVALRLVKPYIVDRAIRWARAHNYCDVVDDALSDVFGAEPKTGWRDSDGFDVWGRDVDGFDKDGYDSEGYDSEGFSPEGINNEGFDRYGLNWRGQHKDSVELLVSRWPVVYQVQVRDYLAGRSDLPQSAVPASVEE